MSFQFEAAAVNLVAGEKPADVYSEIAERYVNDCLSFCNSKVGFFFQDLTETFFSPHLCSDKPDCCSWILICLLASGTTFCLDLLMESLSDVYCH